MWFTTFLSAVCCLSICSSSGIDLTSEPGHLKPLGQGRPSENIEEVEGFPEPKHFFETYVSPLKPLLMKGAAKLSPAFEKWQDEYFISINVQEEVLIESRKKEDRKAPAQDMIFKEFVMIYNRTDQYMVNPVPSPLGADIVLPGPLQCQEILDNEMLLENMMWFSSGGTKSVLHTDSVENINCLIRGEKTFVMIDPAKYVDKVDLDHPEGSYSGVDVDSVDYTKYPGLAEVEYVNVNMVAGDCLYIPFKWIHQVRSFSRNIAVNIWWDYYKNTQLDITKCTQPFSADLTLDKVTFKGLNALMEEPAAISETSGTLRIRMNVHRQTIKNGNTGVPVGEHFKRPGHSLDGLRVLGVSGGLAEINLRKKDEFLTLAQTNPVTVETLKDFFVQHVEKTFLNSKAGGVLSMLTGILDVLDKDKDGQATLQEVMDTADEDWEKIQDRLLQLEYLLKKMEEEYAKTESTQSLHYDEEIDRDEL